MKDLTIKRILVPIDLDHSSQEIMNLAVAMSQRHNAHIRLLYVISPEHYTFPSTNSFMVSMPREDIVDRETRRLQEQADALLSEFSIEYSVECRIGAIAERIVEAATEFKADLIVMGTHGPAGLLHYVMGSEAFHVINQSACPVLTIPEQASVGEFKELLFPVRPIPEAIVKYEFARAIALENQAHITVLGIADGLDTEAGKAIDVDMALLTSQIVDDALETDSLLAQTNAVEAVLQHAEEQNADLIVITADRAADIRHLFVGPFFKQIISQSKRPVLCVKPETPVPGQPVRGATIPLFPIMDQLSFPLNPA
ncbi:universal stress protein [Spirosoma aerolatum]|uniref:universal stress protein n=1 Tax=Spirosoma aerolatum TaxID=1211326 RepID=UPI0009AD6DD6|nr:universal stress protein [Spirosoma aerolatum]